MTKLNYYWCFLVNKDEDKDLNKVESKQIWKKMILNEADGPILWGQKIQKFPKILLDCPDCHFLLTGTSAGPIFSNKCDLKKTAVMPGGQVSFIWFIEL